MVEGPINEQTPLSYLQQHDNLEVIIDLPAAAELTRVKTPWLTGSVEWTDFMIRKSVFYSAKNLISQF